MSVAQGWGCRGDGPSQQRSCFSAYPAGSARGYLSAVLSSALLFQDHQQVRKAVAFPD